MKLLCIFTVILVLSGTAPEGFSVVSYAKDTIHRELDQAKEIRQEGTMTAVTTKNLWISENNENNSWVVVVAGTPKDVYIVDSPAREEKSHYERVHHDAVTHQENDYADYVVYNVMKFGDLTGTIEGPIRMTFPSHSAAQDYRNSHSEIVDFVDAMETERTVVGSHTVVDREAYDETVKVIDQYARKEIGHHETKIFGEIGYWTQGENEELIGVGSGQYISEMIRGGGEK